MISGRHLAVFCLVVLTLALAYELLLHGTPGVGVRPGQPVPCTHGGISAIGPVDAQGRGDTTPEVACLPAP